VKRAAHIHYPNRSTDAPDGGACGSDSADRVYVQRISAPYEYPVHFTRGVFERSNPALRDILTRLEPDRRHRVFLVVDSGVAQAWPELGQQIEDYFRCHTDKLELLAPPEILPGGERVKHTPELVDSLYKRIHNLCIDRQSFIVIVGGGAVLDMAGYVAATTHRGVRTIRIPTTVLAQNDSGIGVKNGINAFGVKNYIGTFAPPFAVINDGDFISTLSERDAIAGIAESIKVSLIRDAEFFGWLEAHAQDLAQREPDAMDYMIRRGAELHMTHITQSGDPFERGSARPLDFGHWVAHKLETISDHRLRHGEAVAIGMAVDSRYSVEAGLLEEVALGRICQLMRRVGLPLWDDALLSMDDARQHVILNGLEEFREHLGGRLTVTLLRDIGEGFEVHQMDENLILSALRWLEHRWN
jgi:3-dehydroquinate synthase